MKQLDLGPHIGALKVQAVRVQSYVGLVQMFLVAVAARSQLQVWFPRLTFWEICVGLVCLYLAGMVADHIFIIKAEYAYTSQQIWKHSSVCAEHFMKIEEKLGIDNERA